MANTKSAKKAVRQIERRTAVNKSRRSLVRGSWRKVEEALASGDAKAAQAALASAESETMRAVSKGVFHKNMGARKVSRLTQRVKTLAGARA
jgi:small subunit ribosomal protein S20